MMDSIHNAKGFTLIEVLIAIAIFGVIIAGLVGSKVGQQDQTITQQQAVEMQQTVRATVFLMTAQLRKAGYNASFKKYDTGITAAGASSITFNWVANEDGDDNDVDGTVDEDGELETITFSLQDTDGDGNGEITMNGDRLADNIQNLAFLYYDEDNAVTADLDEIRSVQITVSATTDVNELARSAANNGRTLTTLVYFRNLGF